MINLFLAVYLIGIFLILFWNAIDFVTETRPIYSKDKRRWARRVVYSPFWPLWLFAKVPELLRYAGVGEDIEKAKNLVVAVIPQKDDGWNSPRPEGKER